MRFKNLALGALGTLAMTNASHASQGRNHRTQLQAMGDLGHDLFHEDGNYVHVSAADYLNHLRDPSRKEMHEDIVDDYEGALKRFHAGEENRDKTYLQAAEDSKLQLSILANERKIAAQEKEKEKAESNSVGSFADTIRKDASKWRRNREVMAAAVHRELLRRKIEPQKEEAESNSVGSSADTIRKDALKRREVMAAAVQRKIAADRAASGTTLAETTLAGFLDSVDATVDVSAANRFIASAYEALSQIKSSFVENPVAATALLAALGLCIKKFMTFLIERKKILQHKLEKHKEQEQNDDAEYLELVEQQKELDKLKEDGLKLDRKYYALHRMIVAPLDDVYADSATRSEYNKITQMRLRRRRNNKAVAGKLESLHDVRERNKATEIHNSADDSSSEDLR